MTTHISNFHFRVGIFIRDVMAAVETGAVDATVVVAITVSLFSFRYAGLHTRAAWTHHFHWLLVFFSFLCRSLATFCREQQLKNPFLVKQSDDWRNRMIVKASATSEYIMLLSVARERSCAQMRRLASLWNNDSWLLFWCSVACKLFASYAIYPFALQTHTLEDLYVSSGSSSGLLTWKKKNDWYSLLAADNTANRVTKAAHSSFRSTEMSTFNAVGLIRINCISWKIRL